MLFIKIDDYTLYIQYNYSLPRFGTLINIITPLLRAAPSGDHGYVQDGYGLYQTVDVGYVTFMILYIIFIYLKNVHLSIINIIQKL